MKFSEAVNSFHLSLKKKLSMASKVGYVLPFSPFRGIVWFLLDKNLSSLLDVGCGDGTVAAMVRLRGYRNVFLVGVDAYLPYLKHCNERKLYDGLVLCDAHFLPFRECSFDGVLAVDVIEHICKSDGFGFLSQLERVASRQVIVSTPVGFMKMYHKNLGRLEDELQRHRSGWWPYDFASLGYKVRGNYGPSFLPRDIAYWLSFILPLAYFAPAASYHMICTKRKKGE